MPSGSDGDTQRMLAHAKGGDPVALGRLLERHRDYLSLLAHLQIGRAIRVKVGGSDVVQEAFLEAHRDFPAFRGETVGELVTLKPGESAELAESWELHGGVGDVRTEADADRVILPLVNRS